MALECTFAALSNLDTADPDAVQALLNTCVSTLLDPSLWEWAIGITLVCALIGAWIGWIKGRWVAGLIWGAALGPIGWVVTALSKSSLRECPECGHGNRSDAKVCRHCGVHFRRLAGQTTRSRMKAQERSRGW